MDTKIPSLYKFMHAQHTDHFSQKETILISKPSYFRDLEQMHIGQIGDSLEGASELTSPNQLTLTSGSVSLEAVNRQLENMGVKNFAGVEGGGQIIIGEGVAIRVIVDDFHIFSLSEGPLSDLISTMTGDGAGYDACFECRDPLGFAQAATNQLKVAGKSSEEARSELGKVAYGDVSTTVFGLQSKPPDPFRKRHEFQKQREWRLVFDTAGLGLETRYTLHVPGLMRFFSRIDLK